MSYLPPNARILEFKIIEHLGSGGFANTYLATDIHLNKKVAIKEFFPHRLCQRGSEFEVTPKQGCEKAFNKLLENFLAEAQTLAKFDEPNIVKVSRYFEGLGTAYIIMDYVEGRRLDQIIAENQVVSDLTTRRWIEELLRGLYAIHDADVIHGDIKPSNIIVTDKNSPVLIDFGASVAFQSMMETGEAYDQLFLTRRYAAPEAFENSPAIDHRYDLFSLAAVFFEVVTLQKYREDDQLPRPPAEILAYSRHHDGKLLRSIERSLRQGPDDRFDTAEDWLEELTLSRPQKFGRSLRGHKYALAASIVLVAVGAWATDHFRRNDIDLRNYQYKLFTSKPEVDRYLAAGTQYAEKVREAHQFLVAHSNEYRSHVDRLEEANLVTARNNKQTLLQGLDQTQPPRRQLAAIRQEIIGLRDKYYFDDYLKDLGKANLVVKSVESVLFDLNRKLLAGIVENGVVEQARAEQVKFSSSDLAGLVTTIQNTKQNIRLEQIIGRSRSLIDTFIEGQKNKIRLRRLEELRDRIRSDLQTMDRDFGNRRRGRELGGLLAQLDKASSEKQLASLHQRATAIVGRIKRETAAAIRKQQKLKLDSEIRSAIQKIEAAMIKIDGGTFSMGGNDQGYARPVHSVSVNSFRLAVNEVSVAQWNVCVKDGKCRKLKGVKADDFPATNVSWIEAWTFISWLNGRSTRYRFRLPSEAEWEYVVKTYGYKLKELSPALQKVTVDNRNSRGVNSIVGNAIEWLDDCWHGGYFGAPNDGSSWNRGLYCNQRVVRGSNWKGEYDLDQNQIAYFRPVGLPKTEKRVTLGFRLAGNLK